MIDWWDKQIQRADQLAPQANGSKELLTFYAQLLRAQRYIYDYLRSRKGWLHTGVLEDDLTMVRTLTTDLLRVIEAHGPAPHG